jgi:hypothetical protein
VLCSLELLDLPDISPGNILARLWRAVLISQELSETL